MSTYLFESLMLLCFGASWPFSILKMWRTKQALGKSLVFLFLVWLGYIAGLTHKILNPPSAETQGLAAYVIWLYAYNFLLVTTDMALYLKYKKK